jgi:hypothetical protein
MAHDDTRKRRKGRQAAKRLSRLDGVVPLAAKLLPLESDGTKGIA